MEWTTEKPTEPGIYWALHEGDVLIVYVADPVDGKIDTVYVEDQNWYVWEFTHWMGPIPKPDPPKETN